MRPSQTTYIVFQAYGDEGILCECLFALLSLSRFYTGKEPQNLQIWIYTDKPEFFKSFSDCPLQLFFKTLDSKQLTEWRGHINFVHRVKIALLIDFTANHKGNILYLDTDIYVLQRPDELINAIYNGKKYMHIDEGRIKDRANPISRKLQTFLSKNKLQLSNKEEICVPDDTSMWNAGVLGFRTGDIPLDEVLELTDNIYPRFPKHIVEQFAFSLYMQKDGAIQTAAPYILHYWNLKELRPVLISFFHHYANATWAELLNSSTMIKIPAYLQEKAAFYKNRSVVDKLMKKRWQAQIPNWDASPITL